MDIWNILGIAPTSDRAAITAAYHTKLQDANPEDKPEEFKTLRAAYEQALKLAKQTETPRPESEKTPAERWISHVDEVYGDIARRRSTAAWQAVLEEDFSLGLVTRIQARDALLRYFLEHFFLPKAIWLQLDAFFEIQANVEELYRTFPREYIDNAVLAGIRNDELLPYDLLEGGTGAQCDTYLQNYSRCRSALSSARAEDAQGYLDAMLASGAQHPYTQLCQARLAILNREMESAQKISTALLNTLPDDPQSLLLDAQLALHAHDFTRAETELNRVIEQEPDLAQARFDLAASLCGQNRYIDAKEIYLKLNRSIPYNQLILDQIDVCNRHILPEREQTYAEAPQDTENALELAWCYHQGQREEDARRILLALPEAMCGSYEYENLASKVYLGSGDWQSAFSHLQVWEKTIRAADETDTAAKTRLPECLRLQAISLASLDRQPEADALLSEIAGQWPQDAAVWQLKTQYAMDAEHWDEALEDAAKLRETSPADPYGHYISGVILFRMGRMQEAYNCFGAAMQRSGRDAGCLLYQCRILIGAGQWDDANKILDDLVMAKIESPMLEYCQARMAAHDKDLEKAEKLYAGLLSACRDKEDLPDFAGEVFYRLVCLQYKKRDKAELLALIEEGLAHDAGSLSLLDLKGDLLRELSRIPEAIAVYEEICRRAPNNTTAYESLGRLYQFCVYDYEKAAHAYEQQLKNNETCVLHNLLGLCYQELARYADAEKEYLTAIQKDPQNYAYRANLAEHYLLTKHYDRAERVYRDALSLPIQRAATRIRLRRQLARLYWRTGRDAEAAALLEENVSKEYFYSDILKISEGWAKAGNVPLALRQLERWKSMSCPTEGEYNYHKALLLLMQGSRSEAMWLLWLGAQRDRSCARYLAFLYCSEGKYAKARRLYEQLLSGGAEDFNALEGLAKCLWWMGDDNAAAYIARQGLALLEKRKSDYNRALYFTQKATLLIALGDVPRAEEAINTALQSPRCAHCYHTGCKDLLSVQGLLEERRGNLNGAILLYEQGRRLYPDEYDFTAYLMRLRKRMKQA